MGSGPCAASPLVHVPGTGEGWHSGRVDVSTRTVTESSHCPEAAAAESCPHGAWSHTGEKAAHALGIGRVQEAGCAQTLQLLTAAQEEHVPRPGPHVGFLTDSQYIHAHSSPTTRAESLSKCF